MNQNDRRKGFFVEDMQFHAECHGCEIVNQVKAHLSVVVVSLKCVIVSSELSSMTGTRLINVQCDVDDETVCFRWLLELLTHNT